LSAWFSCPLVPGTVRGSSVLSLPRTHARVMSREDDVIRRIRERREARHRGELTGLSLSLSVVPSLSPRSASGLGERPGVAIPGAATTTMTGQKTRGQENEPRRAPLTVTATLSGEPRGQDRFSPVEENENEEEKHLDEDEDETLEQLPPAPSPPAVQKQTDRKKNFGAEDEEVPREAAPPSPPTRRGPALRAASPRSDRAAKTGSAPAARFDFFFSFSFFFLLTLLAV
jgi:hypothetical protein